MSASSELPPGAWARVLGPGRFDVVAWENADHLFYVFPSGVVETADRAGLRLVEWFTVNWDDRRGRLRGSIKHWWSAQQGRGISRGPIKRPAWLKYVSPIEALVLWRQAMGHDGGDRRVRPAERRENE